MVGANAMRFDAAHRGAFVDRDSASHQRCGETASKTRRMNGGAMRCEAGSQQIRSRGALGDLGSIEPDVVGEAIAGFVAKVGVYTWSLRRVANHCERAALGEATIDAEFFRRTTDLVDRCKHCPL